MNGLDYGLEVGPRLNGRPVRRSLSMSDFIDGSAAIDVGTTSGSLFDGRAIRFGAAATTTDTSTISGVFPRSFVGINSLNRNAILYLEVLAYKEGSGTDNTDLALRAVLTPAGGSGITVSNVLAAKSTAWTGAQTLRFDFAAAARAAGVELQPGRPYTIALSPNEVVGTNLALVVIPQCLAASEHSTISTELGAAL